MSSPSSTGPSIDLSLLPSLWLAGALALLWLPLLILAWAAGSGTLFALPLLVLIAVVAATWAVRGAQLTGRDAFTRLKVRDNRLFSHDDRGTVVEWLPARSCRLFSRLAWLELKLQGHPHRRRCLIVTDLPLIANLSTEDFRRFRVWLRLGASYH